jgi:hypothetical protein
MDVLPGLITLLLALACVGAVGTRYREIMAPLMVGFVLRAAAAIADVYFYPLPGNSDGPGWDYWAVYYARDGLAGTFEYIGTGHQLYKWLMSVLYALFGHSRLMVQGINVLLGTLIIANTWRLAKQLGSGDRGCRVTAWTVAVFPSMIFFSSALLREAVVTYPLTLAALALVNWYTDRRPMQLLGAFVALLASMAFHSGGAAVLLFAGLWLGGSWLREAATLRFRNFGRNTIALLLGLGVLAVVFSSGFGMQKFNGLETGDMAVLGERQDGFSRGRAVYLSDLRANSPAELVWQSPIRLTYFLFAPFPWMVAEVSDVFGLVDSALFFYLVARVVRRRKGLALRPATVLALGVFAAMAVVFALGVSNYGTALRHRNKMLPLLLAASLSLAVPARRRERLPVTVAPRLAPR